MTQHEPLGTGLGGLRDQAPIVLAAVVVAVAVVALAPLATVVSGGDIEAVDLIADPAERTGAAWYLGAVSFATVLVWAGAAALHLVLAVGARHHARGLATAAAWLGLLTAVLALDDLFLLHEIAIPWVLGVTEVGTFAAYAVAGGLILLRYRRTLAAQPELGLLVGAVVALGCSVALDLAGWDVLLRRLLEEGAKLLGVLLWAAFPARVVVRLLGVGRR